MLRFIAELVSTPDTKETGSMISNKCFIDCPATDKIEGTTGKITATASALEKTQTHLEGGDHNMDRMAYFFGLIPEPPVGKLQLDPTEPSFSLL